MKEQVHSDIKNLRCHNLLDLSKEIWEKYTKTFVDRELEVLIEQIDKNSNVCIGHTTNFLNIATPYNGQNPGDIIKIKIKSCDII
jgi:tRNA A37 methylthiotransferase MiaB